MSISNDAIMLSSGIHPWPSTTTMPCFNGMAIAPMPKGYIIWVSKLGYSQELDA